MAEPNSSAELFGYYIEMSFPRLVWEALPRLTFITWNKVKGERYKPLSITQTDFIFSSAFHEINNIPLFKHQKYLYLSPQMIVNPLLQMTVDKLQDDIMVKYFDTLEPYLELIKDLRLETFIKCTVDKTYSIQIKKMW